MSRLVHLALPNRNANSNPPGSELELNCVGDDEGKSTWSSGGPAEVSEFLYFHEIVV